MTGSMQQGGQYTERRGAGGYGASQDRETRWQDDRWDRGSGERAERVARWLGWFSLGLGLTQLAAPRGVARMIGLRGNDGDRKAMIAIGVREIASGIGILTQDRPTPGVWSRVFGDLLDGVLLGVAATRTKNPGGLAAIFAAVTPVVLADLIFAPRLSKDRAEGRIDA